MRSFVKRILFFIFIPVISILILVLILEYVNKNILSNYKFPSNVSILIAGDSRAQAFNDQIIEGSK